MRHGFWVLVYENKNNPLGTFTKLFPPLYPGYTPLPPPPVIPSSSRLASLLLGEQLGGIFYSTITVTSRTKVR